MSFISILMSLSEKHPLKRKISEMIEDDDDDNDDDDYYARAQRRAADRQRAQGENQFDRYYNSLITMHEKETTLT